jgi:protein-S-isoprenylcysteine O-methyltransferase Ste14
VGLALRSVLWALVLPGVVTGYLPWRFFGLGGARLRWDTPLTYLALPAIGLGIALLVSCIWEFAHRGRGTLSPINPPRELVVAGLYRYVRNPMYLSVLLILIGELLLVPSRPFLLYLAGWLVLINLFVMGYEEPALRAKFGASYTEYTRRVHRWIPTIPSP